MSYKRDVHDGSTTSHAEILASGPQDIEMEPLPKPNQIKVQKTIESVEEATAGQIVSLAYLRNGLHTH